MAEQSTTPQTVTAHPVILLARAIGILIGALIYQAHAPILWAVIGGLTAYALTLISLRSTWPGNSAPTPKPKTTR